MPSNPTTTSQVQAYRFELRRLQSALVRRDPVMLHEPMRTHSRAALVGVVLGVLGIAAFFVIGLFAPTEDLRAQRIVLGEQSGALFVVVPEPLTLVPVHDLASARLLLAALSGTSAGGPPAEVTVVDDAALADAPRAPLTGLVGAPADLPGPDERVAPQWSVCDRAVVDEALPDGEARPALSTTALVGVPAPGRPLAGDEALLVQERSTDRTWLVFDGHRGEVDLDVPAVVQAYRTAGVVPRPVSTGLLNAVPEGRALDPPAVPGAGEPSPFPLGPDVEVGTVVRQDLTTPRYYLVLRTGKQEVSEAVAELVRVQSDDPSFATPPPEAVTAVPDAPQGDQLDLADYPDRRPDVLGAGDDEVACLGWRPDSPPTVTVAADVTVPAGMRPVRVPGADGDGNGLDAALVPPGRGALVRGVVPGQPAGTGAIHLVTDQGLQYGVPSADVAVALGLGGTTDPAPEAVLSLLPRGPSLDPRAALELYDPAAGGPAGG